jgi:succinate dehydrogenase hydrophobic anchor subunit
MTTIASTDAAPSYRWLRVFLVLIAALEFLDALSGVQNIFTDYHHDTALLRFAQALTSVSLALSPVLAGAALIFAALGNIRRAILALAVLVLAVWLLDGLPSIAIHGIKLTPDYGGLEEFLLYFFAPATAVAAALLARKDRRLPLAGVLVCLPALFKWIGGVIFLIAVMIYGF